MRPVYIGHSGTAVIFERLVFIFDYEKGEIPHEAKNRETVFFASHAHKDHFNPEIFSYGRGRDDIQYVLSFDITGKYRKEPEKLAGLKITEMRPAMEVTLDSSSGPVSVRTLKSTDEGVAFVVGYEGRTIYHAGDLNCWAWPYETKQYRNNETADYQREIDTLKNTHINLAFVPLDPRLSQNWRMGMDYFLENIEADRIMPIHMWGRDDLIEEYRDSLREDLRSKILDHQKN